MPAVNTAMAMIDPTIHSMATARPGIVRGPKFPAPRCVIATVVHHTPEAQATHATAEIFIVTAFESQTIRPTVMFAIALESGHSTDRPAGPSFLA